MIRLGSRLAVVVLTVLVVSAALLEAQTRGINDQEIQGFVLPGTSTKAMRVHANRSHMNLSLPYGNIIARGGYKVALAYAHSDSVRQGLTNSAMPIAGSIKYNTSGSGISYQRTPYAGSIIAVTIGASTSLTSGSATCEPTILRNGSAVGAGFSATLNLNVPQYAATAQPRDRAWFLASEAVGVRLTTSSDFGPVNGAGPIPQLVCGVVVEY